MKRWLAFAPLLILAALAALFAGYALKRDPHVQPHALVGKPMPALALPALDSGRPAPIRAQGDGPIQAKLPHLVVDLVQKRHGSRYCADSSDQAFSPAQRIGDSLCRYRSFAEGHLCRALPRNAGC